MPPKRSKNWRKAALAVSISAGLASIMPILMKTLKVKHGMSDDEIDAIIEKIKGKDGKSIDVINGYKIRNGNLENLVHGNGFDLHGDGFKHVVGKIGHVFKKAGRNARAKLEEAGKNVLRHAKPHKKNLTRAAGIAGASLIAALILKHPNLRPILDSTISNGMDKIAGFKEALDTPENRANLEKTKENISHTVKTATKNLKRKAADAFEDPSTREKVKRKAKDFTSNLKHKAKLAKIEKNRVLDNLILEEKKKEINRVKRGFSDILD